MGSPAARCWSRRAPLPLAPPHKGEGNAPHFQPSEFDDRLAVVRAEMEGRGIDLLLVSAPENIFYLTGLDHWGYFAPHVLIVPAGGELILVTRAMERVTIANQVRNARFEGHPDNETAADRAAKILSDLGVASRRIGLEAWSAAACRTAWQRC